MPPWEFEKNGEIVKIDAPARLISSTLDVEMEAVQRLPHLRRHLMAHRVRVVPRPRDALRIHRASRRTDS